MLRHRPRTAGCFRRGRIAPPRSGRGEPAAAEFERVAAEHLAPSAERPGRVEVDDVGPGGEHGFSVRFRQGNEDGVFIIELLRHVPHHADVVKQDGAAAAVDAEDHGEIVRRELVEREVERQLFEPVGGRRRIILPQQELRAGRRVEDADVRFRVAREILEMRRDPVGAGRRRLDVFEEVDAPFAGGPQFRRVTAAAAFGPDRYLRSGVEIYPGDPAANVQRSMPVSASPTRSSNPVFDRSSPAASSVAETISSGSGLTR